MEFHPAQGLFHLAPWVCEGACYGVAAVVRLDRGVVRAAGRLEPDPIRWLR